MAAESALKQHDFEHVLPALVTAYVRGRLVPFLGAGMSVPKLVLWENFVRNLENEAGLKKKRGKHLEERAQRASVKIRNSRGRSCFLESIAKALLGTSPDFPPQTTKLASIRWPLVVSTNYDDLYFGSCLRRLSSDSGQPPHKDRDVQVLGRSPGDCKRLLSALHGPFDRQYIWHVQGFLGGQFGEGIEEFENGLDALRDQLVVGHARYRLVTNASPHFRRCFGEMFSSCSFLFLGSNLSEQYFLNLFGEVQELLGPSSVPHFAFVKRKSVDAHFLADQMNITVCEFDEYNELEGWLEHLKREIECPRSQNTSWSFAIRSMAETQSDLEITRRNVSVADSPNAAIALVARRDKDTDRPILPPEFASLVPKSLCPHKICNHVCQYGNEDLYAVTARCTDTEDDTAVAEAVKELLDEVNRPRQDGGESRKSVHLQLSPTGGTVPPVFAFMECVRAFGEWRRKEPKSQLQLILHIQSEVALNLTSDRINVQELLSSELIRFWTVVVAGGSQEPTRRILYYKKDTKLRVVLDDLDVPSGQGVAEWKVSICPSSQRDQPEQSTWSLRNRTLESIGVVFGSVLTIECFGSTCGPNETAPKN